MNSKLTIFIFVIFALQLVNSSIIRDQFINDSEADNNDSGSYNDIKYLNFKRSDFVYPGGAFKVKEVQCLNQDDQKDDLCNFKNGQYQAETVRCENLSFKKWMPDNFKCEYFGAKVTNKNVKHINETVYCAPGAIEGKTKGKCIFNYSLERSESYSELDDVKNN